MHDRRINGRAHTFGNHGALWRNAMTWWDHETGSVWTQVWGQALEGPLKGTRLSALPAQVVPWLTWREQFPDTQVLRQEERYLLVGSRFEPEHVIGVTLEGIAKAYPYRQTGAAGVINDHLGSHPVLVYVDAERKSAHVYLRTIDRRVLTFERRGADIVDRKTGSSWNLQRGLAVAGPLRGRALRPVPHVTAYERAWRDFYPESLWYR